VSHNIYLGTNTYDIHHTIRRERRLGAPCTVTVGAIKYVIMHIVGTSRNAGVVVPYKQVSKY